MSESPGSLLERLEAAAQARFVRWDGALWREMLSGPARELSGNLLHAGRPEEESRALVESYLRLTAEGIGRGYLFPAASGGESFLTLAFMTLLPRLLPALPRERQAKALAECWNLGENLESGPPWLKILFLRLCRNLQSLYALEGLVRDVSRQAFSPPEETLKPPLRPLWLNLGEEDKRFLPGSLHFVAPAVVCVHDRHRTAAGGRTASTVGVWLAPTPLLLGAMGCNESLKPQKEGEAEYWRGAAREDLRLTPRFASIQNPWRAAATLETSQFLVALLPAAAA
jgi:hypothetical protein